MPDEILDALVVSTLAEVSPTILLTFINPANIALVTVPVSPVVITVPVVAGNVITVEPAMPVAWTVTFPEVAPLYFTLPNSNESYCALVKSMTVVGSALMLLNNFQMPSLASLANPVCKCVPDGLYAPIIPMSQISATLVSAK